MEVIVKKRGDWMKKVVVFSMLLGLISFTSVSANAQESTTDNVDTIVNRAAYQTYKFSSYPPKTYKGLVLHQVKKVKDGYLGLYI